MVKRAGRFRSRGRGGHGGVVNQRAGRDVSSSDEELERELGVGDAKHSSPRANGAENEHKLQVNIFSECVCTSSDLCVVVVFKCVDG